MNDDKKDMGMSKVDENQQISIEKLVQRDKMHEALFKIILIVGFCFFLMMAILLQIVLNQKIYIENRVCPEDEKQITLR